MSAHRKRDERFERLRRRSATGTPPGQVSFCRWQVLGSEIDFRSAFDMRFEIGSRNPAVVDRHRVTAFFYL